MKKAMKKPTTQRTPRQPKPKVQDTLHELQLASPHLTYTIRDRRAVVHWPATLNTLRRLKRHVSSRYGIAVSNFEPFIEAMEQAANAASQWPTCSCGSLCRAIPRQTDNSGKPFGPPIDKPLRTHGLTFYNRIREGDLDAAEAAMDRIEARATTLLRRLGKQKHSYADILVD